MWELWIEDFFKASSFSFSWLDVQLFRLAAFPLSPHPPSLPEHHLARTQHSLSPIPLENVESALTLTPIRELCSCSHTANPRPSGNCLHSRAFCTAWQGPAPQACDWGANLEALFFPPPWLPEGLVNWELVSKKKQVLPLCHLEQVEVRGYIFFSFVAVDNYYHIV